MRNLIFNFKKYFIFFVLAFIFVLFFYITYKTPLAGDDWGFYLNAQVKSPILLALEFYQSFSGRFFSELWEHFGASHKWFWNILNPTLFVVIVGCIYKFCCVYNHKVISSLVIIAVILSVDDNLRMETYTWLTGEIYIIPLALSLIYFVYIESILFNTENIDKKQKVTLIIINILCFYIGMTMENIAAIMIVALIMILIYSYFCKKQITKYILINLMFSMFGFILMRLSPGSTARMIRDHYEWSQLSIIEKIINGYPKFIEFSFINNNYMILILSAVLSYVAFENRKKIGNHMSALVILICVVGTFTVFSFVIPYRIAFLSESNSLYNLIFWIIYTINVFFVLITCLSGETRLKALFMLIIAGGANAVMIFSPIFGSRSSIYTVFFVICVIVLLLESVNLNRYFLCLFSIVLIFICADRTYEYSYKYHLVGEAQKERLSIIEYYKSNPDVEEAWIPRFPIYTVHGADIEPGDTYHFETFKLFYELPQSADKIIFYFKDN